MQRLTTERQKLVTSNLGIAYAVLRRLNVHGKGFEEALCEAKLGLCEAAATFDEARGGQFSTWAWLKTQWRVVTWLRRANRHPVAFSGDCEAEHVADLAEPSDVTLDRAASLRRAYQVMSDLTLSAQEAGDLVGVSLMSVVRFRNSEKTEFEKQIIAEPQ